MIFFSIMFKMTLLISRRMILLTPFTRRRQKTISTSSVIQGVDLKKDTSVQMEVINPKFRAILELSNDADRMITKKQRIEWFDVVTGEILNEVDITSYMIAGDEL